MVHALLSFCVYKGYICFIVYLFMISILFSILNSILLCSRVFTFMYLSLSNSASSYFSPTCDFVKNIFYFAWIHLKNIYLKVLSNMYDCFLFYLLNMMVLGSTHVAVCRILLFSFKLIYSISSRTYIWLIPLWVMSILIVCLGPNFCLNPIYQVK